jgi:hypothetical protein
MNCPNCKNNASQVNSKPRMFIEAKDENAKDLAIKLLDEYKCNSCGQIFFI